MRTLIKSGVVATAALAAAVGVATSPAAAAGTWTVTPGGAWTATATTPTLKDTTTGTTLTCASSSAAGVLKTGSGNAGTGISTITSVSFVTCKGPLSITFTVAAQGLPWALNAVSYASGVTTGTITGVKAHISGACNADFNGPTLGSTATLNGTYTNSTKTLSITGGNLKAYNVSGLCLGLINNGDAATFTANYVLAAAQTITSP